MEFNIYIFIEQAKLSQIEFDIVSMHKFFALNDNCCKKLVFLNYDKDSCWQELEKEEKNKIVFMENSQIDDFTFSKLSSLGKYIGTVDEQALVFEKDEKKIIFLPIDNDWQKLLKEILKKQEGRKTYSFQIFASNLQDVKNELEDLKKSFDSLTYSLFYNNLLCNVVLSYLGQLGQVDEVHLRPSSKRKAMLIGENGLEIEQAIFVLLRLKNCKIAIFDSATGGHLEKRLFEGQNFNEVLTLANIESEICQPSAEGVYNFSLNKLKSCGSDIVFAITKVQKVDDEEFIFAIADKKAVHVFKNKFVGHGNKIMASNSALFQLFKKLKQNDFAF